MSSRRGSKKRNSKLKNKSRPGSSPHFPPIFGDNLSAAATPQRTRSASISQPSLRRRSRTANQSRPKFNLSLKMASPKSRHISRTRTAGSKSFTVNSMDASQRMQEHLMKFKSQLPKDVLNTVTDSLQQYRFEKALHQLVKTLEGTHGMQRQRSVYDIARSAHYPRVRRAAFERWLRYTYHHRVTTNAKKKRAIDSNFGEWWVLQKVYVLIRDAARKRVAQAFRRWVRKLRRAQHREQEQAAIKLQAATRGFLARLEGTTEEQQPYKFDGVKLIQKMWRDRVRRNRARAKLEERRRLRAVVHLQKHGRAKFARRRVAAIVSHRSSITIQRNWRGSKQRAVIGSQRGASVTMQRVWRGTIARRQVLAKRELEKQLQSMSEALSSITDALDFGGDGKTNIFASKDPGLSAIPCTLTKDARTGATTIHVTHVTDFAIGDRIVINPGGATEEISCVRGFGSVLLEAPVRHAHYIGEMVQHLDHPHGEASHRTKQRRVADMVREQEQTAAQRRALLHALAGKMSHARQQLGALAATADDPTLIESALKQIQDVFAVFVLQRDEVVACDRIIAANRLAVWFRAYLHRRHWRDVRESVVDVVNRVVRQESAALLQAFFRRTVLRCKMRRSGLRLHREREGAVRRIQREWHEMKIRRMNFAQRQQHFAAQHLQAVFRSYNSRQKTKKIFAMWTLSAQVMLRAWRGNRRRNLSRRVLARWIQDTKLTKQIYLKTLRAYVSEVLKKRQELLQIGLKNHRQYQYKAAWERLQQHVVDMKWMRKNTKRALRFYNKRLKRKSFTGWLKVFKQEKKWRLDREAKMKELMGATDSKNMAEMFHKLKVFKKCFLAWEKFLRMCIANQKRAVAHYNALLAKRLATCHRHWVQYHEWRKLKHRARAMGLRAVTARNFRRLRKYAVRRIAKRVRLQQMREWHRKRFNGRVFKHWRSWQQSRARVRARATAFVTEKLTTTFAGWKKVTVEERARERRLQAQALEFWKSQRAALAIKNMYQNRVRARTLRSMNLAALQHSRTALMRMVVNRWRAAVDQIYFFRRTARIAPILQSFWRWKLAKIRVVLQRHLKNYCAGEIIKRRKQLVEVQDIDQLKEVMEKYEWVVLMMWVPWARGERDGIMQSYSEMAFAGLDYYGKKNVIFCKIDGQMKIPVEFLRVESALEKANNLLLPMPDTHTTIGHQLRVGQYPALRVFWRGRPRQPVGAWHKVCEHFACERMDRPSMDGWFADRVAMALSESTRIAIDIQRAWRGRTGRVRFERFKKFMEVLKRLDEQDKKKRAAAKRAIVAEQTMAIIARTAWTKCWDVDNQEYYWYNVVTRVSQWEEPGLIAPEPEHEDYERAPNSLVELADDSHYWDKWTPKQCPTAILCPHCMVDSEDCKVAVWYCADCGLVFCPECFMDQHKKGQRRNHTNLGIEVEAMTGGQRLCVSCGCRAAYKECNHCNEGYCNDCFLRTHSKGGRVQHKWEMTQPNTFATRVLRLQEGMLREKNEEVAKHASLWQKIGKKVPKIEALTEEEKMITWGQKAHLYAQENDWKTWQMIYDVEQEIARHKALVDENEDILREAFDIFDIDHSGTLERNELKLLFEQELLEPITDKELDEAIAMIDTNKNGVIEFNEFCDWFVEEMLDRPEEEGFLPKYSKKLSVLRLKLRRRYNLRKSTDLKEERDEQFQLGCQVSIKQADKWYPGFIWKRHTQFTIGQVKRNDFNYDVMLTHARKNEVAVAVHWTLIRKRPTVPGYPDVPKIDGKDYESRKQQINRFARQHYEYNIDMVKTDDKAMRRVYDHLFLHKWNEGKLTNSYYYHLRVLWHNGLWWKQFWNFDKDFFYFKSRRSGQITLENPVLLQALRDQVWDHFVKYDKDGSGTLTAEEVQEMLEEEMCEAVTDQELEAAMRDMDEDDNGVIEFQEFLNWYTRYFEDDERNSTKMGRLRAKLRMDKKVRKVTKELVKLGPTAKAKAKFQMGVKLALDNAKAQVRALGKSAELFELMEEGYDQHFAEKALQICSGNVDEAREWLNRNHPKGTHSKSMNPFARLGRFIRKQRKKSRRKKMDDKRLNAKRSLQMQMKRFDKTLTMEEFEKLMGDECLGCSLCDCDEYFQDMGTGNCAACGHPREDHTLVYEWHDGIRPPDEESVSESDTEEEVIVIPSSDEDDEVSKIIDSNSKESKESKQTK